MLESISLFHPNERTSYGKNYFTLWDITKYCNVYLFIFKYTKFPDFIFTRIFTWKHYSNASTTQMVNYSNMGGTAFSLL